MQDHNTPNALSIHPDVDPEAWLVFERRMQSRRVAVLVATGRAALQSDNVALAERMWHEAREIAPDADDVLQLQRAIAASTPVIGDAQLARRATVGVALLVIGIAMVIAVDRARPVAEEPQSARALGLVAARQVAAAAPASSSTFVTETTDSTERIVGVPAEPAAPETQRPRAQASHFRAAQRVEPRPVVDESTAAVAKARVDAPRAAAEPAPTHALAPTTVAITPSPAAELDTNMPGASVAELLANAAERVASTADSPSVAADLSRLADVLRRYANAYGTLDVNATRALWPAVDERALAAAFTTQPSRYVSFDACDINVQGSTAFASCRGRGSAVHEARDVANSSAQPRTWRFELRRDGEEWHIESAESAGRVLH